VIDLETRLRETMARRAAPPIVRPMPTDTPSRVRRRRAFNLVAAAAFVVIVVAGVAGALRLVSPGPAARPAAEATVAMPSPNRPDVTYVTPAPFADLAPGEWPNVETGTIDDPYVDRVTGEEIDKTVVASGFVEGAEWSMTAFALNGWGTCGELFVGDWGDYGGVRFCSDVRGEPGQTDLRIVGTSFGLGPITAYAGVVSPAVDRVVVELADGSRRSVDLVNAPEGLDDRSFVVFVPIDAAGRLVAFNADGGRAAAERLCVVSPAPLEQVTSCGNGMATNFSAVSGQP